MASPAGTAVGRATARRLPAAAFAALLCAFAFELWRHLGQAGDLWTFWAAARAVRAGLDPYVAASLARVAPLPAGPAPGPFLSPLVVALAMAPLGALPFSAAQAVWLGVNLAASAALVLLLLRLAGAAPRMPALLGGAAVLMAFQPYDLTLWLGQTDVVVCVAIAGGWLLLRGGRPVLGGFVVGLAAVDVHLILGLGAYFVYLAAAERRWRPLVGLGAGLLAVALPSLANPHDLARWVLVALPHAQRAAIEPWDTLSVLQAASEMLGRGWGWVAAVAVGVGMVALAFAAWRRGGARRPERDLAVAVALTLATTTFAYNQDYLLLVLALPFVARLWADGAPAMRTGALAFVLAPAFGIAELTGGPIPPRHAAFVLLAPLLAGTVVAGLAGARGRLRAADRWWAAAWAAATPVGYALLTLTGTEIGAEVVVLCGVCAFLGLAAAWPQAGPGPHVGPNGRRFAGALPVQAPRAPGVPSPPPALAEAGVRRSDASRARPALANGRAGGGIRAAGPALPSLAP